MKWRLWRRDVPGEFIEEPVVLIVAKENGCGFSADAGLLLKANDIKFVWAQNGRMALFKIYIYMYFNPTSITEWKKKSPTKRTGEGNPSNTAKLSHFLGFPFTVAFRLFLKWVLLYPSSNLALSLDWEVLVGITKICSLGIKIFIHINVVYPFKLHLTVQNTL